MSKALREPFGAELISKLPRITCPDCRRERSKVCASHKKYQCSGCGSYITEKHIHLDYVGHADVTDRLLAVDPEWDWQPVAVDELGLPIISRSSDGQHIMWIKLTIGGVTRLGVGSVSPDTVDIEKQLIGDALRNAGIRFGIALDLWSKAERGGEATQGESVQGTPVMIPVTVEVGEDAHAHGVAVVQDAQTPTVAVVQDVVQTRTVAVVRESVAVIEDGQARVAPVVFADEPLPEYHGEDGDADWGESDGGNPAPITVVRAIVTEVHPVQVQAETARSEPAHQKGVSPMMDSQKAAIKGLFDTLEVAMDKRASHVSAVVGREVSSLAELSRTEASKLLRHLTAENEGRIKAAFPGGAASGF